MHTSSKWLTLCSVLLLSCGQAALCAQATTDKNTENTFWEKHPQLKHYLVHSITGAATASITRETLLVLLERNNRIFCANPDMDEIIPKLLTICACFYMIYKTPQWTDKYLLKKTCNRTTKQNMLNFFIRLFIKKPFGILGGEFCSELLAEEKITKPEIATAPTN